MFARYRIWLGSLLLLGLLVAPLVAVAQYHSARQYYGSWRKHPSRSYHYRSYYYKPTPTYTGYKHHYVVYHPSRPKHVYYYNPYKKTYWGRCPTQRSGEPVYSMLKPEHRKPTLEEIPEAAFPEPGKTPPIPDSDDGALLDLPPDDLPDLGLDAPDSR